MRAIRMTAVQPLSYRVPLLRDRLWETVSIWRQRARDRRGLAELSDYELRDIGITPAERFQEMRKPFWRG